METIFTNILTKQIYLLLISTYFIAVFCLTGFSQQHNTLQFSKYGYEEGLPINPIDVIYQDQKGYMWFGSKYGLCRYDGYSFQLFQHDPNTLNSLSHSHITSIAEDSRQNLWVGTIQGFNKIDSTRTEITQFFPAELSPTTSISNQVYSIYINSDSEIWIGGVHHVSKYNPDSNTFTTHPLPDKSVSIKIFSIQKDKQEKYWLGTERGLYSFNSSTLVFTTYPYENLKQREETEFGTMLGSMLVYDLLITQDNNIWIGTWNGGLAKYNLKSKTFTRYPFSNQAKHHLINNTILSISKDQNELLWLGTVGGLYRLNPSTNELWHDSHSELKTSGLSYNRIRVVHPERSGATWVATDMMLHRYDPSHNPFQFLVHDPSNPNSLSANAVYSMCEDQDRILWFGTHTGGLNSYDPSTGMFQHYKLDPKNEKSLPDNTITALCPDPSGKIWVGTWTKGICLFDPITGVTKRFPFTLESRADPDGISISGNTVRAIHIDPTRKVWIGTEHGDLSVYDPNTERFHYYINPFQEFSGFTHASVYTIYEDQSGQIWVGTGSYSESHPGLGLYRYDDEHDCFDYIHTQRNMVRFWDERVPHIFEDQRNQLWLATQEGLSVRNLRTGKFTHYYPTDGFWGTFIYSVVPADDGTIWVSTDQFGLSRLNPETNEVQNFGLTNGLQNLRYLSGSALKAQDGTLYFGGMGGVTVLPKGELPINMNIPSLAIKSIQVLEDKIPVPSVARKKPYRFSYRQNVIQFEFTSLNYTFPNKNRYQYRLLGLQDQWSTSDTSRTASYSYLPPGEYKFQVKGSNNDDVWNESPVSFTFVITPPFWQTWWFRSMVAFLVVSFLFGLYAYRVNRMKAINQRLEKEVINRTSLLQSNFTYLENIINTSPLIIVGFDSEEQITFINPAGLDILDSKNISYIGLPFWAIASNSDGQRKLKEMIVQYKDQKQLENQITLSMPGEYTKTLLWNFVDHFNENGEIIETLAFGKDITDHLEKELLEVSSREQHRIGQEIHDSLCQTLTGLHYMCESVITEKERLSERKSSLLEKMHIHLKKVTDQSRSIARSLYLVEKESKQLDKALLALVDNIENLFGVNITVHCSDAINCENSTESIHIYRIVQEALSNAVKYSQSHTIELTLQKRDHHLDITIKDHGTGFDLKANNQKGMGIGLMHSRAKIVGADLRIHTSQSNGTTVLLSVPIPK